MDKLELIPTINDAFWAIHNNNLNELKRSIRDGNFDINEENEFGETLLGTAIWLKMFLRANIFAPAKTLTLIKQQKCFWVRMQKIQKLLFLHLNLQRVFCQELPMGKSHF